MSDCSQAGRPGVVTSSALHALSSPSGWWDPEWVNARRLELLRADPATAPHKVGVLVIDDSGTARTGPRSHMWADSGWSGTARPITAWSP